MVTGRGEIDLGVSTSLPSTSIYKKNAIRSMSIKCNVSIFDNTVFNLNIWVA